MSDSCDNNIVSHKRKREDEAAAAGDSGEMPSQKSPRRESTDSIQSTDPSIQSTDSIQRGIYISLVDISEICQRCYNCTGATLDPPLPERKCKCPEKHNKIKEAEEMSAKQFEARESEIYFIPEEILIEHKIEWLVSVLKFGSYLTVIRHDDCSSDENIRRVPAEFWNQYGAGVLSKTMDTKDLFVTLYSILCDAILEFNVEFDIYDGGVYNDVECVNTNTRKISSGMDFYEFQSILTKFVGGNIDALRIPHERVPPMEAFANEEENGIYLFHYRWSKYYSVKPFEKTPEDYYSSEPGEE